MNYILFEEEATRNNLLPLTYTRPVANLRVGILSIQEKWNRYLNAPCSYLTEDYLQDKFTLQLSDDNIFINGAVLPHQALASVITLLENNTCLMSRDLVIAYRSASAIRDLSGFHQTTFDQAIDHLAHPWDIFTKNGQEIEADFALITKGRKSATIDASNQVIGSGEVFIEEGAKVSCAVLNTSAGSIYIGKNTEVMEGSLVRGPFALCEGGALKLGAKIYGPTTVGPHSKVGGEVNNSVIQGYSNKGHDGFLGNSVLGEWCNIGADSNNSNLKNNYAEVKVWNYPAGRFINTGLQFCGLIMGDHSKCGINTMFNTGTVVGVSANIFGSGFPRNFVPSFSWGGAQGFSTYATRKAFEVAEKVMERRQVVFDQTEKAILEKVFELSSIYRKD